MMNDPDDAEDAVMRAEDDAAEDDDENRSNYPMDEENEPPPGGDNPFNAFGGDQQIDANVIEQVSDGCLRNQQAWIRYPTEFIRPAKMCSVNKYVQCVEAGFAAQSIHHVARGAEFVLIGHDNPSMPTHMFQWIWAMSQINMMKTYSGCIVPVEGVTEVRFFFYCSAQEEDLC